MRHIRVRVPDEQLHQITQTLEELAVDYVVTGGTGPTEGASVVAFPLPTDAVDDVLSELYDAGLSEDAYVVVGAAEAAMTEHSETLLDRYADDFDPLTRFELRSKARDLSRDRRSYVAMIALSAVIATLGILLESPAVIVGSMVIAPFVGPILTAGVGALTADRKMVVDSVLFQGGGILVAVLAALATATFARWTSFVPDPYAIATIESMATRLSPGLLSIGVGLFAGAAAAYGLATKGPTALIGVMIAAALVPTAAAIGIGVVWGAPIIFVGASILLVATVIAINVGVVTTLWWLGYRPDGQVGGRLPEGSVRLASVVTLAVVVAAVAGVTVLGAADHAAFERDSVRAVEQVLNEEPYKALDVMAVRQQYGGLTPLTDQRTVTVVIRRAGGDERYPDLPSALADRIATATGDDVAVEVRFVTYHHAESADAQSRFAPPAPPDAAGSARPNTLGGRPGIP